MQCLTGTYEQCREARDMNELSAGEHRYCQAIREKDDALRAHLANSALTPEVDPRAWLHYLTEIRSTLGNLSNDLGFVASLLIKEYLQARFQVVDFDAASKAQGAAGADVVARTADGKTIIGELKTTIPYMPGFGAQQRTTILKDFARLAQSDADHRFMFVTDGATFRTLCTPVWSRRAPGIEIVDIATGEQFLCPGEPRLVLRD